MCLQLLPLSGLVDPIDGDNLYDVLVCVSVVMILLVSRGGSMIYKRGGGGGGGLTQGTNLLGRDVQSMLELGGSGGIPPR